MKDTLFTLMLSTLFGSTIVGSVHAHLNTHEVPYELATSLTDEPENASSGCVTYYTTIHGEPTLIEPAPEQKIIATPVPSIVKPISISCHTTSSTTLGGDTVGTTTAAAAELQESRLLTSGSSSPSNLPLPSSLSASLDTAPTTPLSEFQSDNKFESNPESKSTLKPVWKPGSEPASPSASKSNSEVTSHISVSASTLGSQWCITYSPYQSNGLCKAQINIESDIASIAAKGFSSVRLYSTDCSGLQYVGDAAKKSGLRLVLGIYISGSGIGIAQNQVGDITSWAGGDYSNVEMVVVGNEAVFNGFCTASELATFVSEVKETLERDGYSGPVTLTETLDVMQLYAATFCPVIDIVAANLHPYFNPAITAAEAGTFVASQLADLAKVCPGTKQVFNLETGWPRKGNANGAAIPGQSEQNTAIMSIKQHAGEKSIFSSFGDDMWKDPGPWEVEQSWGCDRVFD